MKSTTLNELFKGGTVRTYPKGQIILYQGDALENYYFIKSGFIKIYTLGEDGTERIMLLMGRNESFPILNHSLSEPYLLKYFYEAMTAVKLQIIQRQVFNRRIHSDVKAAVCLLEYAVETSARLMQRLSITESKSAVSKVSGLMPYFISKFSRKQRNNIAHIPLRITHQDIANMTGLTRETTSIQMKQLERGGVIKQHRSGIRINTKKLNEIAES